MHSENRSNGSRSFLPLERTMHTTRKTHVRHSPVMRAYKVTVQSTAVSVDHRPTPSFERQRDNHARHYFCERWNKNEVYGQLPDISSETRVRSNNSGKYLQAITLYDIEADDFRKRYQAHVVM